MCDGVKEGEGHEEGGTAQVKYRGCWASPLKRCHLSYGKDEMRG